MAGRVKHWRVLLLGGGLAVAAVPASPELVLPPQVPSAAPAVPQGAVPVLLVPGWSDNASALAALRARLIDAGWRADHTAALSFEDEVGSNRDHASEIADAVQALRAATGAERVDVVAHSMGGLATRAFLAGAEGAGVRRVVFLATPHEGTVTAFFGWGEGAREMQPGSRFLEELAARRPVPEGVAALTIRTTVDVHVVPLESATLPGVPDLRVCCPTHAGLLDDDETFARVREFLTAPQ